MAWFLKKDDGTRQATKQENSKSLAQLKATKDVHTLFSFKHGTNLKNRLQCHCFKMTLTLPLCTHMLTVLKTLSQLWEFFLKNKQKLRESQNQKKINKPESKEEKQKQINKKHEPNAGGQRCQISRFLWTPFMEETWKNSWKEI